VGARLMMFGSLQAGEACSKKKNTCQI